MKPLLIIKTGHTVSSLRAQWEDFEDWIVENSGLPRESFKVVSVFKDEPLPLPSEIHAVFVTGSPKNVTEQLPWMEIVADWLRAAVAVEVPVLGICFGHQLLSYALGGEVAFHAGGREIGTIEVELTESGRKDVLFDRYPERFYAQSSHSQTVSSLPSGAVVLASNSFEPHHAVRFARQAWGVQFHPEFSRRVMAAYLDERRTALEREGLDHALLSAQLRDTPVATSLLSRFIKLTGFDSAKQL